MSPARLAATALLPLAAVALILGGVLAWCGWYQLDDVSDVPLYLAYGARWLGGGVPYRDFAVEYPPLALPLFALPAWLAAGPAAARAFQAEMLACLGGAALAVTAAAAHRDGQGARPAGQAGPRQAAVAFAVACGALGAVCVNRFDAAVALLLSLALLALATGRLPAGAAALGLGAALKLSPAALLPLVLLLAPDRRTALRSLAAFALAAGLPFLPALLASPGGVAASFAYHLARPLQLESVPATPFLAAHLAGGPRLAVASAFGSQNLVSPAADLAARLGGLVTLAALALVLALAWRARAALRRDPGLVALAALALLLALLATGKVLSPQYLVWLLPPLALAGAGRARLRLLLLVVLSLGLTQAEFPARYWALVALDGPTMALVVARNGSLLAALGLCLMGLAHPQATGFHQPSSAPLAKPDRGVTSSA